jgi:hypothetical protein
VIKRENRDGTFDIDYDDGEKEMFVAAEMIRPLDAAPSPSRFGSSNSGGGGGRGSLREGMKVEGNYRGTGRYYKGVIKRENRDGSFDIDYDDGEKEMFVAVDLIRPLAAASPVVRGQQALFKVGDTVEARYRGKNKYYSGRVSRVNDDATFDIDYDDGEKEFRVRPDFMRAILKRELSPVRTLAPARRLSPQPISTRLTSRINSGGGAASGSQRKLRNMTP